MGDPQTLAPPSRIAGWVLAWKSQIGFSASSLSW